MGTLATWETLPLEKQVAQLIVARASGHLFDRQRTYPIWEPPGETLRHWIADLGIGGVILLGGSAAEVALRSQQLQTWAELPLLLAADIEEGVGQRFAGATHFPPPMALAALVAALDDRDRALACARAMGACTAREALAIGLNWVVAPVVDVNNNPDNPVINVRAFGDDPATVAQLATAFLQGTAPYPVLTTAKHFPGHGDTATDSHVDLPTIPHASDRLETVELPPFRAAIAAGVSSIMSAHLLVPAWDAILPATLSPAILTGKLRQELGFQGLIVTDALVMGAIARRYGNAEAAVLAVKAGADLLMMPADPEGAIAALCQAIETHRIPRSRLQESLERLWQVKSQLGTPSDVVQNVTQLAQPQDEATVRQILLSSMRWGGTLPLAPESIQRTAIATANLLTCDFLKPHTPAIALPQRWGWSLQLMDDTTPAAPDPLVPTLLQLFVRGNPFRGSAGLPAHVLGYFEALVRSGNLSALAVYGSPYVLEMLLPLLPPGVPYAFSFGQMPVAQELVLEKLLGDR